MLEIRNRVCFLVLWWSALAAGCTGDATGPRDIDLSSEARTVVTDYATRADAVFVGEVTRIAHQVSSPDASGLRLPFTLVTWRVDDDIKGVVARSYTARFLGGPLGDRTLEVAEIPTFAVGDRDLLFVRDNGTAGCPLVDGALGRLRISGATMPDGLSPNVPSSRWLASALVSLRATDLGTPAVAAAPGLDEPFVFAWPRSATGAERLAAERDARAPRAAAALPRAETAAERAERLAYEANGRNPVLPR